MVNSRNKGAAGEREAAKEIARVFGVPARRGQQYSGSPDSPDVVTGIKGVHFEIKRVESLNIHKAMAQAVRDAAEDEIPVVMSRRNREPWFLTVMFEDAPELAKRVLDGKRE